MKDIEQRARELEAKVWAAGSVEERRRVLEEHLRSAEPRSTADATTGWMSCATCGSGQRCPFCKAAPGTELHALAVRLGSSDAPPVECSICLERGSPRDPVCPGCIQIACDALKTARSPNAPPGPYVHVPQAEYDELRLTLAAQATELHELRSRPDAMPHVGSGETCTCGATQTGRAYHDEPCARARRSDKATTGDAYELIQRRCVDFARHTGIESGKVPAIIDLVRTMMLETGTLRRSSETAHRSAHFDTSVYVGQVAAAVAQGSPTAIDEAEAILLLVKLGVDVRWGCGEQSGTLVVDLLRRTRERASSSEAAAPPGPCPNSLLLPTGLNYHCRLRAGHAGMHEARSGTAWDDGAWRRERANHEGGDRVRGGDRGSDGAVSAADGRVPTGVPAPAVAAEPNASLSPCPTCATLRLFDEQGRCTVCRTTVFLPRAEHDAGKAQAHHFCRCGHVLASHDTEGAMCRYRALCGCYEFCAAPRTSQAGEKP